MAFAVLQSRIILGVKLLDYVLVLLQWENKGTSKLTDLISLLMGQVGAGVIQPTSLSSIFKLFIIFKSKG